MTHFFKLPQFALMLLHDMHVNLRDTDAGVSGWHFYFYNCFSMVMLMHVKCKLLTFELF